MFSCPRCQATLDAAAVHAGRCPTCHTDLRTSLTVENPLGSSSEPDRGSERVLSNDPTQQRTPSSQVDSSSPQPAQEAAGGHDTPVLDHLEGLWFDPTIEVNEVAQDHSELASASFESADSSRTVVDQPVIKDASTGSPAADRPRIIQETPDLSQLEPIRLQEDSSLPNDSSAITASAGRSDANADDLRGKATIVDQPVIKALSGGSPAADRPRVIQETPDLSQLKPIRLQEDSSLPNDPSVITASAEHSDADDLRGKTIADQAVIKASSGGSTVANRPRVIQETPDLSQLEPIRPQEDSALSNDPSARAASAERSDADAEDRHGKATIVDQPMIKA